MDCSPIEIEALKNLINAYSIDEIKEAIDIAVMRNNRSLAYIKGILKNMHKKKDDNIPSEYAAIPY